MKPRTIEAEIIELFETLSVERGLALIEELQGLFDDGIEVEIVEDDEWNKAEELKPLDLK